ncbi:MAG: sigma-70 family RNA polymerase sigma factor [Burkholderiales bacterium]|nr:sigma-70 family RNA polymerase sigma factor [Burkholderiales bacterium]
MADAPPFSDADLIARVVVHDDRNAFAELVRRHQSAVRASLRKLARGDEGLADDLAQETFLLAYRNLAKFRFDAKFSTWLYRIAHNVFVSDARKMKEVLHDTEDDLSPEIPDSAPPLADSASLRLDLDRAMECLNDAERAVIVQCYYNDLSHDEASQVLGMPLGTVKTHVLKAKEKMKSRMAAWQSAQKEVVTA